MNKKPTHQWRFASSSGSGTYETLQYEDGSLSCDCPGWTRRAVRTCKHTRAVQLGITHMAGCIHDGPLGDVVDIVAGKVAGATVLDVMKPTGPIKSKPKSTYGRKFL